MTADAPRIVVGVSTRSGSPTALQWAQEYAGLSGGTVVAVMAWRRPRAPGAPAGRPPVVPTIESDPQAAARTRLAAFIEAALGANAQVEQVIEHGSALSVLRRQDADLYVLGSPRDDTLADKLVAPKLARVAECPLVIMPRLARPRAE